MLTDFHNSLTARLSGKFVTNAYLNIPPHLKCCVAILPCEISIFKNRHAQVVIEAKCRVRLSHSKNCFTNLSGKMFIILFTNKKMFTPAISKIQLSTVHNCLNKEKDAAACSTVGMSQVASICQSVSKS